MTVSSFSVNTDLNEYCKYDSSKKIITVIATAPAGELTAGDSFLFTIRRHSSSGNWPDPYANVMKKTVIATSDNETSNSVSCSFVIGTDDIDEDFIARAISGTYIARVSISNLVTSYWESSEFFVVLIPTAKFKQEWLFGVPLKATEILSVKFPPRLLTGISVDEISQQVVPGIKQVSLTYTNTPAESWTLSWDGGPAEIILPSSSAQQVLLTDETNINYIVCTVRTLLLPKQTISENLLVAEASFTEEMIRSRIQRGVQSTEAFFGFPIEPYLYTSIPVQGAQTIGYENHVQEYWDRIARPRSEEHTSELQSH